MSGRSSRSTLMQTKCLLRIAATSSFSNDSCSMTWHVAGRVADGQEDRLVLLFGAVEGFGPPGVPVDRVVRVLEEVLLAARRLGMTSMVVRR